jgi:hypothetical protein
MPPDQEEPPELGPEASKAVSQLRDGIARARKIVREAKQAIGQAPPEGAVLSSEPEESPATNGPVIPADRA